MQKRGGDVNNQSVTPLKKVYEMPGLRVYGDIQTMTQAVSNKSATGDGGMGLDKTQ